MLRVESLSKSYGLQRVLEDVHVTIGSEIKVLLGVNGCGKSTLLKIVAGIIQPDDGRVVLNDVEITALPPESRRIGYVPQKAALFPHLSVEKNIFYGVRSENPNRDMIDRIIDMLGVRDFLHRKPNELSGGYKSRVSLARALAPHPKMMLLDEPLSDIDATTKESLLPEFRDVLHFMKIPTMYVTHDPIEAEQVGDTFAIMRQGCLTHVANAREAFEQVRRI